MAPEPPWHIRMTDHSHEREFEDLREISRLHHRIRDVLPSAPSSGLTLLDISDRTLTSLLVETSAEQFLHQLRTRLETEGDALLERVLKQGVLIQAAEAARIAGEGCAERRWSAFQRTLRAQPSRDLRPLLAALRDSPFVRSPLVKRATARSIQLVLQDISQTRLHPEIHSELIHAWIVGFVQALQPEVRIEPLGAGNRRFSELKWEI
ncbi:MAG: hypothetical protein H7222_01015 [Methylotenera sp.]|nr:hypothetical protein [Oligoflexia bacterium]